MSEYCWTRKGMGAVLVLSLLACLLPVGVADAATAELSAEITAPDQMSAGEVVVVTAVANFSAESEEGENFAIVDVEGGRILFQDGCSLADDDSCSWYGTASAHGIRLTVAYAGPSLELDIRFTAQEGSGLDLRTETVSHTVPWLPVMSMEEVSSGPYMVGDEATYQVSLLAFPEGTTGMICGGEPPISWDIKGFSLSPDAGVAEAITVSGPLGSQGEVISWTVSSPDAQIWVTATFEERGTHPVAAAVGWAIGEYVTQEIYSGPWLAPMVYMPLFSGG